MRPEGWRAWVALVLVALLFGTFVLAADGRARPPVPLPGPPANAPRVVVAMGDSTMSGEGAGDYEKDTDGADGDWCHRSPHASVHQITSPSLDGTIDLACSGAPSAQVGLGDVAQYGEPSQAGRLASIATRNRVEAVVVASGANDDPSFAHTLDACVEAWTGRGDPCSKEIGPRWRARVDAMVPKLVGALRDIRTVMRNAGYQRSDYQLVVQSYAAPVADDVAEGLQDLSGCPFLSEDLRWVQRDAVPVLTAGVRRAAGEVGARFLDLSRAGRGHEACSAGEHQDREWFRRLAVEWQDLREENRATHALQESFHPNATGHRQLGRCLAEFLLSPEREGACLPGADGQLHAAASVGP